MSRLISRTQPDPDGTGEKTASITVYDYDVAGRLVGETDPLGARTAYAYDAMDRRVRTTLPDPDGSGPLAAPATTFAYDAVGDLLGRTDPTANTTTYAYDALDRVTTATNESQDARSYVYDANGNVLVVTDRDGRHTQYIYDALNRRTSEAWYTGGTVVDGAVVGGTLENAITYAYDADGRLTSAGDNDSSYTYTLDNLGRVTEVDLAATSLMPEVVLAAAYDMAGRRTGLSATVDSAADFVNTYEYDAVGRLTSLGQGPAENEMNVAEKRIDFAYTAAGTFDTITRYSDLAGTT
jgi:YD repeat-containing protein